MKTNLIKTFALSAVLVGSSLVYAQEQNTDWQVGDSVKIKEETKQYLTGEEPSTWVYPETHHIMQIGSKRFPDGILLKEIISWVGPNDITYPDGAAPESRANGETNCDTIDCFVVGDSVMIKRSTTHYLTGEEPSTWVYDRVHVIQQLGSSRFPNGVLISREGIYSWLAPINLNKVNTSNKPEIGGGDPDEIKIPEGYIPVIISVSGGDTTVYVNGKDTLAISGGDFVKYDPVVTDKTPDPTPVGTDTIPTVEKEPTIDTTKVVSLPLRMQKHHRFSIGVRGGAASLMQNAEPMNNWKVGFDGILDLQYAYYFGAKDGKKVNHGIITGLSVGYSQSPLRNGINDTILNVASDDGLGGTTIDYYIKADKVNEMDRQLQIEVPLMYSLLTEKGFFMNVGARFMMPVWKHYNQTISNNENTEIKAVFNDLGVTVTNEDITGVLGADDYKTKGNWAKGKTVVNVMLTAELGWEWELKSRNSLGFGVYANYAPYNSYSNSTEDKPLVSVTAPQGSTIADATPNSAINTYTDKMNYFDAGLKLVYHFQFEPKK